MIRNLFSYHVTIHFFIVQFRIKTMNSIVVLVNIYNSVFLFHWFRFLNSWKLRICIWQFIVLFFQTFLSFLVWNLWLYILSRRFVHVSTKWIQRNVVQVLFLTYFFHKFFRVLYDWRLCDYWLGIFFLIKIKWNLSFFPLRLWLN